MINENGISKQKLLAPKNYVLCDDENGLDVILDTSPCRSLCLFVCYVPCRSSQCVVLILGPVFIGCSLVARALVPLWRSTQTMNLCFALVGTLWIRPLRKTKVHCLCGASRGNKITRHQGTTYGYMALEIWAVKDFLCPWVFCKVTNKYFWAIHNVLTWTLFERC